jgi:hypothetical protein
VGVPSESDVQMRNGWLDTPDPSRLNPDSPRFDKILERHSASVDANLPTYADPLSGFSVFTAAFLAKRGYCCESGCRHCPFAN